MTYSEKLKDPRWQKVRLKIMERDGFACRDCSSKRNTLHVHHCFYEGKNPWDTEPDFLLTLCKDCHESRQLIESNGKRILGELFSNLSGKGGVRSELYSFVAALSKQSVTAFLEK